MTPRAAPPQVLPSMPSRWEHLAHARASVVAVVWLATFAAAVLAPPLVTGPDGRHIPVAAPTAWVSAGTATGFLYQAGRAMLTRRAVATVVQAWAAAGFLASSAPAVVVGGSTIVPVASLVSPVVACLVTVYAVLAAVTTSSARPVHGRG